MKSFLCLLAGLMPVLSIAAPQPLIVDTDQSRVEIVVKATVDSFTGKLNAYTAGITVDEGRVTAAKLEFHFVDVLTGKEARDEAMHDWQQTAKHPDCSFVLAALEPAPAGRINARGTLTLHGVAREISFPVSVTTDHTLYAVDGEVPIDTRDFGLPIIRKFMLLKVDPVVTVRFHLQGSTKPRSTS